MRTIEHPGLAPDAEVVAIAGERWRTRSMAVAVAVLAALAVWLVTEVVFGLDLRRPAASVGGATDDVNAVHVAFAATIGSLAGWALLAILERLTSRARLVWTAVAVLALLFSLGGPLSGSGISDANRLALVLMHLVVAAVVIAGLRRTMRAVPAKAATS